MINPAVIYGTTCPYFSMILELAEKDLNQVIYQHTEPLK